MPTSICAGNHVFIGMNENIVMLSKFVTDQMAGLCDPHV
jgi:hypothetical protein